MNPREQMDFAGLFAGVPSVKLRAGQKTQFVLEEYGSSGYSWKHFIEGPSGLVDVSTETLRGPPSTWSGIGVTGGGGHYLLVAITALAPGQVRVHLVYSQAWVKD